MSVLQVCFDEGVSSQRGLVGFGALFHQWKERPMSAGVSTGSHKEGGGPPLTSVSADCSV